MRTLRSSYSRSFRGDISACPPSVGHASYPSPEAKENTAGTGSEHHHQPDDANNDGNTHTHTHTKRRTFDERFVWQPWRCPIEQGVPPDRTAAEPLASIKGKNKKHKTATHDHAEHFSPRRAFSKVRTTATRRAFSGTTIFLGGAIPFFIPTASHPPPPNFSGETVFQRQPPRHPRARRL